MNGLSIHLAKGNGIHGMKSKVMGNGCITKIEAGAEVEITPIIARGCSGPIQVLPLRMATAQDRFHTGVPKCGSSISNCKM